MAITSILTKTNINTFAEWMNINPLSFNNIDLTNCVDEYEIACKYWNQYPYNDPSFISREYLAQMLSIAETMIENYIETNVKPTYIVGEEHLVPIFFNRSIPIQLNISDIKFITNYKNIIAMGQKQKTLISNVSLTYSDADLDGVDELATLIITLPTGITIDKIKAFYPNKNLEDKYNIRIKSISQVADVATITFNFYELLKEQYVFTSQFSKVKVLDGCNSTMFLEDIDIAYEITSTCLPHGEIVYIDADCTNGCEEKTQPFCTKVYDSKLGIFSIIPQTIDDNGCMVNNDICLSGKPIKIKINYYSGTNSDFIQFAVFNLAAAMLNLSLCGCMCIEEILTKLQIDTALKTKEVNYQFPFSTLSNPFGTKLGQLEAYKLVESYLENNYL